MTTKYKYHWVGTSFGYFPKYWEDTLTSGTDKFGKANDKLKKQVKKSRELLKELEKE